MFRMLSGRVSVVSHLVIISMIWSGIVMAAQAPQHQVGPEEVLPLYNNLSQNIEKEASLYSEYTDYRGELRVKNFWKQVERLNLTRDEIIQMITLLEKRMEGQIRENPYKVSNDSFTFSGTGSLSNIFSNWRPFYFLISGGFFLVISTLLFFTYCVSCRENVLDMMISGLRKMVIYDSEHFDRADGGRHHNGGSFKKAA